MGVAGSKQAFQAPPNQGETSNVQRVRPPERSLNPFLAAQARAYDSVRTGPIVGPTQIAEALEGGVKGKGRPDQMKGGCAKGRGGVEATAGSTSESSEQETDSSSSEVESPNVSTVSNRIPSTH
jgi:hypothetical protein